MPGLRHADGVIVHVGDRRTLLTVRMLSLLSLRLRGGDSKPTPRTRTVGPQHGRTPAALPQGRTTVDTSFDSDLDTVVIGAGQAGLALAYYLRRDCRRFVVLEAADRVGDSWRRRWDSLTLFTPRRYDALPGLSFPGDPEGYPGKDEVADYLEGYARHFDLPVLPGSPVISVRRDLSDGFAVETGWMEFSARQVVVATGGFSGPLVPQFGRRLDPRVVQLHSSAYRNPASVPDGEVMVVGAGNTGVQIAKELAEAGRRVTLSVSSLGPATPQRLLGKRVFWWFDRLGLMR